MRHQLETATLATLATLALTLVACDPPEPKSIGSLDDDTGETTDDGDICGPSLVDLEFEVSPEVDDLDLSCAAEVTATSDGYQIDLTNCIDAQGNQASDVTVTLYGDWSEPLVDDEPQILLSYVRISTVINEEVSDQRWLSLRNPGGEQPLLLVAVDAISTYPAAFGEYEFDYAPLAIDSASTECPLIEDVACAPIQPGALVVSIEDQPFMIPEGREDTISLGSESYHVVVEENHEVVDDCPDYPSSEYVFGIVAK